MKYIKKVSTTTEYNTLVNSSNYFSPNVTYVTGSNDLYYEPYDPILTFKALTAGSTVNLSADGSPEPVSLSTSTNGTTWTSYTVGDTITLTNIGDKVMFKATTTNATFNVGKNYYHFMMTGSIAASGDVTSLLNGTGGDVALTNHCFGYLFNGCRSLATAPSLPTTTLTEGCYEQMFSGCSLLTTAPALPAMTLADHCYQDMFNGCTSLTTAPALPATTLRNNCYNGMFFGCTSLVTAPALPATTLTEGCYQSMFNGCTSLTTAPELPATTLEMYCYHSMFNGCTNLNYIKAMFTTTPSTSYTDNWVYGVAASGTFVKNSRADWNVTGVNGVPSGWTVETADS